VVAACAVPERAVTGTLIAAAATAALASQLRRTLGRSTVAVDPDTRIGPSVIHRAFHHSIPFFAPLHCVFDWSHAGFLFPRCCSCVSSEIDLRQACWAFYANFSLLITLG
jgi:hypothetical protein